MMTLGAIVAGFILDFRRPALVAASDLLNWQFNRISG